MSSGSQVGLSASLRSRVHNTLSVIVAVAVMFTGVFALNPKLALATPSMGAGWTLHSSVLIDPTDVSFAPNGIGAPTVEWDDQRDRYVMFFEFKSNNSHASCGGGIWGLGFASSTDGLNWGNFQQIYLPDPGGVDAGEDYQCVMAHPSFSWLGGANPNYNSGVLLYKAEDGTFRGINQMTIAFNGGGTPSINTMGTSNLITIGSQFGFQAMEKVDSHWAILVQVNGEIKESHTNGNSPLNPNSWSTPAVILSPSQTNSPTWDDDELFGPEPFCEDDGTIKAVVGGRNTVSGQPGGVVSEGAWAYATYNSGSNTWSYDTANAQATWNNDRDMRHFSHLLVNTTDDVVWFSQKNATDTTKSEIGVMYTATPSGTYSWSNPRGKRCP